MLKLKQHKFHQHKSPISIYNVSIERVVVSNKVLSGIKGFKYFIGYKDGKKCAKMCAFDETKYAFFDKK